MNYEAIGSIVITCAVLGFVYFFDSFQEKLFRRPNPQRLKQGKDKMLGTA